MRVVKSVYDEEYEKAQIKGGRSKQFPLDKGIKEGHSPKSTLIPNYDGHVNQEEKSNNSEKPDNYRLS